MLAFALASLALMAIPGPDMALIMRNAVVHGRRTGLATMLGGLAGLSVHATASVAGLSALLATSATAFAVVKLVGAVYLTLLGGRGCPPGGGRGGWSWGWGGNPSPAWGGARGPPPPAALAPLRPRPHRSERRPCLIATRCARVG